jgi:hypothetical protein
VIGSIDLMLAFGIAWNNSPVLIFFLPLFIAIVQEEGSWYYNGALVLRTA